MPSFKQSDIEDHFPTSFGTGFSSVLQQMDSRLWGCGVPVHFLGKTKTFNKLGKSKARKITSRKGDTRYSKESYEYYTMDACPFDIANCFDEQDDINLGEIGTPNSEVVQNHAYAYHRSRDEVFLKALGGVVHGGPEGRNECKLPDSQKVAIDYRKDGITGVNMGLTVDKILRGLELLGKAEAYGLGNMGMGKPKLIINQCALTQLMCEDKLLNGDYVSGKPMDIGYMSAVLGAEIIRTELLPEDTVNDVARAYLFLPSAIRTVEQRGRRTRFDILPEKNHSLQIRTDWRVGAMRYEDKGVIEIHFDQSPTIVTP